MEGFAQLLKRYREQAGLSQRGLARLSRVNPAIISRMEAEDRGPSGTDQVFAIAEALRLDDLRTDALLASAGFWPRAIVGLGPSDETLLAVARVLSSGEVDGAAKERFRRVVDLLAAQWNRVSA